jgi:hypothetical protein
MITTAIGLNAGKIWNTLNEQGEQPLKNMIKKLRLSGPDFYLAIGWLAREGKICHFENDGAIMICLKE